MKWVRSCAAVAALACLAACGGAQAPQSVQASSSLDAVPTRPALANLDAQRLRMLAAQALRGQRMYAPAGDNAVEYYLALRDKQPGDAIVANALQELQPYVLIAGEQALAGGELNEAQRMLDLLARVDAQAPALPRLRESLLAARAAQVEQSQRLDAQQAEQLRLAQQRALANAAKPAAPIAAAPAPATIAAPPAPAPAAASPAPLPESAAIAPPPPAPRNAAPVSRPLPRLISDSAPRYPLSALNRRIEGSVQIAFVIQPDGSVTAVRLLSSTPPGVFDEAALAAVSRWRFEAGGERVPTSRTLSFRLPKG
ncbi:energy transducer TonB [Lysobacter sp. cf310]|uniref:energy transducer TonB n=1 Tax=Lysobacter sp. cf310 TaxID=1761790 RepID=UPI0008E5135B|nr:energy transducer TonB [Lysobacter sp. cf310]SFK51768.1 protein TonB [Lysobacter sp. cf310]